MAKRDHGCPELPYRGDAVSSCQHTSVTVDFIPDDLGSWAGVERKAAVRLLATCHITDWRYGLQSC